MDKELRILILEDVPADAELEEYELRKSGLVFTSKIVDTQETFLQALDEFLPDIILSDYDLPAFDGLAALRIAKGKCPDVPFILVSGKVGEEFAIEKLREGATDYVLKGNLKRLVPVIKRAVEEAQQIAEQNELEESLRLSEERYRSLLETQTELVCRFDSDGTFNYVNDVYCHFFGKTRDELIGTKWHPLPVDEDLSTIQEKLLTLSPANPFVVIENRVVSAKGDIHWVQFINKGLFDLQGNLLQIQSVGRDITERRLAGEKLQESEERFRKIFEEGPIGIVLVNPADGRFLMANDVFCQLIGYTEEELTLLTFAEITHPEHREEDVAAIRKLSEGKIRKYTTEKRYLKKNGEIFWGAVTASLIRRNDAKPLYFLAMVEDIMERKKAEANLLTSASQWQATFDAISDAASLIDLKGTVLRCNRAFSDLLGKPASEIVNGTCWELVHGTSKPIEGCPIERMKVTGQRETMELSIGERYFDVVVDPIKDGNGHLIGAVHIVADITQRKRAEEEAKNHIYAVESLNKRFVGREMKMIELKKEVNSLLAQIGQPKKYMW